MGCDFDRLHDLPNHHHRTVRAMLAHGDFAEDSRHELQTVIDNVSFLTPELLSAVGRLVVDSGHAVAGKKPGGPLRRRCGSFAVETDVRHLECHRILVTGVGDQVQAVAEPALHLRPGLARLVVHAPCLVLAPVRLRVRGLARLAALAPRGMALDRLAVVAEVFAEIRQRLLEPLAQRIEHPRHAAGVRLHPPERLHKPGEVPRVGHRRARRTRKLHHRGRARSPMRAHLPAGLALPRQRVESAYRQQPRIAPKLPQQRPHRGMLEHHPGHQRPPHRLHRIVVPAPAPAGAQRLLDRTVRRPTPASAAACPAMNRHRPRKRVTWSRRSS